jgi:hypothetical protein
LVDMRVTLKLMTLGLLLTTLIASASTPSG